MGWADTEDKVRIIQPKISVITPSYNQGGFIEDAVLSVLKQGYPNFEHIIIDGGSTDDTLEILRKYPHLIWISEPDKGQSDALNKGFKMATGDIMGWLNADDYYLPGAFSTVVSVFAKDPDVNVVYGNWYFVDTNCKIIKKSQSFPFDLKMLIYYGPYIGSTALFFRRSIIDEGNFININFRYTMEREWMVRLGNLGKRFYFVNKTLACFRLHGDNQSARYEKLRGIDRFLTRAQQLAESYAIRRLYGHHWGDDMFGGSLAEEVSYRILWCFYRFKAVSKKLFFLIRTDFPELKRRIKTKFRKIIQ